MKTLLIYATYSGSTLEVSNYIASVFTQKGFEIKQKDAREVEPDEFNNYDLIILGSPTWGEGDAHDLFKRLIEKFDNITLPGKHFAIFGLGDTNYAHFCGAAEQLEEFVKKLNGKLIIKTHKINNFYFNQQEEIPRVENWAIKMIRLLT